MRKSTILAAFLALHFAPQAHALDWTAVPSEMVMVAPSFDMVAKGVILWRLVHATIQPGAEFTDIRVRFIGSSAEVPGLCKDSAGECHPNALGRLDFRLRNQPSGAPDDATAEIGIGGTARIDKPMFDLAYMADLVALFTGGELAISAENGIWSISSEYGYVESRWKPMSLRDTSQAAAFAANLDLPLREIGDCVVEQVIAAQDDQSPKAAALRANIDEIARHWLLDPSLRSPASDKIRLRHMALGLLAREENIPPTAEAALKIDDFASLAAQHGDDIMTNDYERLRLAAEYEKRLLAAKARLGGLTAAYICENLVAP